MHKKKVRPADAAFSIVNYLFFGLITIVCFYPFYYLIINSISANDLSAAGKIILLPQKIHLGNYKKVLQLSGLLQAVGISVARTVLGTMCTVLASAFLGFMFTQERMWKRKLWYRFVVITMYFNAGMIPMCRMPAPCLSTSPVCLVSAFLAATITVLYKHLDV